jgi:acyl phosphate:glycerol-3-phosphate acyltransferase
MVAPIRPAVAVLLGYAAGAMPVSNLAARMLRGIDLRTVDTGTVSGTNLYRVAGFGPLAAAGLVEVGKGAVGPLVAGRDHPLAAALAGALAVTGHNWSPLLNWAGGRGFSPAIGALAVLAWPGALLLLGGLAAGRLLKATAPVSLGAALAAVPVAAATGGRQGARAAALVVAPMLAKRLAGNTPATSARVYLTRLLYDRDVR